jgi:hypothetical protein
VERGNSVSDHIYQERAKQWLLDNGYEQWRDGEWSYEGNEVNAQAVLAEYIETREKRGE